MIVLLLHDKSVRSYCKCSKCTEPVLLQACGVSTGPNGSIDKGACAARATEARLQIEPRDWTSPEYDLELICKQGGRHMLPIIIVVWLCTFKIKKTTLDIFQWNVSCFNFFIQYHEIWMCSCQKVKAADTLYLCSSCVEPFQFFKINNSNYSLFSSTQERCKGSFVNMSNSFRCLK